MIYSQWLPNGARRPAVEGERWCPFAFHIHSGDAIEQGLELIICEHKYTETVKEMEEQ